MRKGKYENSDLIFIKEENQASGRHNFKDRKLSD